MNTTYENLVSTTLSTPMVYYNSYHYSPEEIELRYGAIKFGSAEDLSEYFKAGVNALESKNLSMAISNFTKVAEMVPSFLPAINNLGTLYYNIGRLPEAIHFFEQGISKDPKNFQVRYNLGTLYCLNQNFQQAKDQLVQAKSLVPNDPAVSNNLALSLLNLEDDSKNAENLLFEVTSKNVNYEVAFHNYAFILTKEGKYDEAIINYNKVINKNKKSFVTMNDLACCYFKKGNIEKALSILYSIIESTGSNFQPALYNLGFIVANKYLLPFDTYDKE